MKRRIRLSESDLHRLIKEYVIIIDGQYNLPIGVFNTSEDAASYLISRIMETQEAKYVDSNNETEKCVYEQIKQTKDEYGQWLCKYDGKKYECVITKLCVPS